MSSFEQGIAIHIWINRILYPRLHQQVPAKTGQSLPAQIFSLAKISKAHRQNFAQVRSLESRRSVKKALELCLLHPGIIPPGPALVFNPGVLNGVDCPFPGEVELVEVGTGTGAARGGGT